jgi:hypothetical protein
MGTGSSHESAFDAALGRAASPPFRATAFVSCLARRRRDQELTLANIEALINANFRPPDMG